MKLEIINNYKNFDIKFFDTKKAINRLGINEQMINSLEDGKFGYCPPFLIISSLQNKERKIIRYNYIIYFLFI